MREVTEGRGDGRGNGGREGRRGRQMDGGREEEREEGGQIKGGMKWGSEERGVRKSDGERGSEEIREREEDAITIGKRGYGEERGKNGEKEEERGSSNVIHNQTSLGSRNALSHQSVT